MQLASTSKDFAMPGHGSPWKFLLDTGMEHLSLPRQAYKAQETDQNVQIKGNRKDYTSSWIKNKY